MKFKILLYILFFGIFIGVSFINSYFYWLSFFGLVPLLFLNDLLPKSNTNELVFSVSVYFGTIIWHLISVGWMFSAFITGPLLILLINPLFYTLIWLSFRKIYFYEPTFALLFVIISWICMEYLHLNWELSFTFLHLGNIFGSIPIICQWYSFTGVLGGTLWILLSNVFVFKFFKQKSFVNLLCVTFCFIVPIVTSIFIYLSYKEPLEPKIFVKVLHPNMDCRNERKILSDDKKLKIYSNLSLLGEIEVPTFVLSPENSFFEPILVENLNYSKSASQITKTICISTATAFISGYVLGEFCHDTSLANKKGRYFQKINNSKFVFTYNGAVNFNKSDQSIQYRTKKKLVPVEEFIPYPQLFRMVRNMIPSLGGFLFTFSSHDNEIMNFANIKFSTLICYESTFGQYTASLTRKGAEVFFLLINEGWYKNFVGANMFQNISRLRAIESRRYIIRSSNDGISSIINEKGNVLKSISDFKPAILEGYFIPNKMITFYSKFGDWIGFISLLVLPFLIIYSCFLITKSKVHQKKI